MEAVTAHGGSCIMTLIGTKQLQLGIQICAITDVKSHISIQVPPINKLQQI